MKNELIKKEIKSHEINEDVYNEIIEISDEYFLDDDNHNKKRKALIGKIIEGLAKEQTDVASTEQKMFVLQQLNFKNWIPFYGNQKIIFSVDPNKNITFIEADNMAGKTSIYRGILWCMFGDTGDKDEEYSKYIDRLNLQAMGEKDYKYQVELKLKFKGKKYLNKC